VPLAFANAAGSITVTMKVTIADTYRECPQKRRPRRPRASLGRARPTFKGSVG
jgi:hypothetical protein